MIDIYNFKKLDKKAYNGNYYIVLFGYENENYDFTDFLVTTARYVPEKYQWISDMILPNWYSPIGYTRFKKPSKKQALDLFIGKLPKKTTGRVK